MEIDQKEEAIKLEINSFNELSTYFVINEIGGFVWKMNHDMGDGRIPQEHHAAIDEDIKRMQKVQMHAVGQLSKFGVSKPFRDEKKTPSAEYWAWFRWWDSYIKGLSEEDWKKLDSLLSSKGDTSAFRPAGDWRERIPVEEEAIKKAEEFWKKVNKE